MKTAGLSCARILLAAALSAGTAFAATYETSVHASLQFPDPVANVFDVTGSESTRISDYFFPIHLSGNAGFSPFAGMISFRAGLLSVDIGGPSGFAHPHGLSVAKGLEATQPVSLVNLTSAPLTLVLRVEYSYSIATTADAGEAANASMSLGLDSQQGADPAVSVLDLARAVSFDGSDEATGFADVPIVLPALSSVAFSLRAATSGEASTVPEPKAAFTAGGALVALLLVRSMAARTRS